MISFDGYFVCCDLIVYRIVMHDGKKFQQKKSSMSSVRKSTPSDSITTGENMSPQDPLQNKEEFVAISEQFVMDSINDFRKDPIARLAQNAVTQTTVDDIALNLPCVNFTNDGSSIEELCQTTLKGAEGACAVTVRGWQGKPTRCVTYHVPPYTN